MKRAAALALILTASPAASQEGATLVDDTPTLTTGRVTREFRWNEGHVAATLLRDESAGREWRLAGERPDLVLPGVDTAGGRNGRLAVEQMAGDAIEPPHLLATIVTRIGPVAVTRRCKLFRMSPAIGCELTLAGAPAGAFARAGGGDRGMIEDDARRAQDVTFVTDRLAVPGRHWRADTVRFQAATDHADTLVDRSSTLLYREDRSVAGNVLLLRETGTAGAIFVLKEAPGGADQLGWSGRDFLLRTGDVRVAGSGFSADEAAAGPVATYAVVIGVADGGETAVRLALRDHFATVRRFDPARDAMVMSNSWGDRSRDSRMNEAFLLREIDTAAALGLTHVQLDDGWQAGLSRNSASKAGQRWEDWSANDWRPHPTRFPQGLTPLVARARERGVRLGLWFNPSQADDYAAWRRDADILIGYWRDHGIASAKIDGVNVATHAARRNLEAMFERVHTATRGQLVINMDVTAGRRPGYFAANRYGNIFLENRYTDWGNYYPHRTLRNLWTLAAWLPPQWLQVEFLNVSRNPQSYAAGDPLAPAPRGQGQSFAAAMVGQPLAWMELTGLAPTVANALRRQIAGYRTFQPVLHGQAILPIGVEPDGASWTGFQSISADRCSGFVIIYREPLASAATADIPIPIAAKSLRRIEGAASVTGRIVGQHIAVRGIRPGANAAWSGQNRSGQCNQTDTTRK